MKKTMIGLIALFGFTASTLALAQTPPTSGYYINHNTQALKAAKAAFLPPTNITVLNYTDGNLSIVQPVNYLIPSGNSRTISHDTYYGNSHIVLNDWFNNRFFDMYVCNRAILTVNGQPPVFHVDVNPRFCT